MKPQPTLKNLDGEKLSSIESDNMNEDDYNSSDKEIKDDDEDEIEEQEEKKLIKEMAQISESAAA